MVGSVILIGLLGLNGWLVLLNLAKHDRLPAPLEGLPGLAGAVDREVAAGADEAADGLGVGDGEAAPFTADGDVQARPGSSTAPSPGTIAVDDWPGGRGPVPDGPPVGRQVLVGADGGLLIVGSAPDWSVVTGLVDALGRRLGRDPSTIAVDVGWHPEASTRLDDGEVVLEEPLQYRAGQIELPEGDGAALESVAALLAVHPELYVVVVGLVDDDGGDEAAAIALGRTTVVAEELVASGVESERVVTSVASVPSVAPDGDPALGGPAVTGDRVIIRIENLLVFGPGA